MESFDQALKYLLHLEPEAFIRFGLLGEEVRVVRPVEVELPSRGRSVDGSYLLEYKGKSVVAHVEFHRRNQSQQELAVDVLEAQVRLFRREQVRVLSHVWDLYGEEEGPLVERQELHYGAPEEEPHSTGVYHRVNLRGMGWEELLTRGPRVLWPLVALARGGASEQAVREVREALVRRVELSAPLLADHLAVLSFIAEVEGVPVQALRAYIPKEQLMMSTLYQEIFDEGKLEGKVEGARETQKKALVRILTHRLGELEPSLRERLQALESSEALTHWYEEALEVSSARAARKLVAKISRALAP